LNPLDIGKTIWGNYAKNHSYSSKEVELKHDFVGHVIHSVKPKMVWDFGCNTGDYSVAALKANAPYVVGFDFDQKALELAFARAKDESLSFLPLFLDAGNPAPNQGFGEQERQGLKARANPDCLLALAFTHHLAIGRNVPLPNLLDWLISLAPHGVIEFVPKSDPMIQEMLSLREDIFDNYTGEHFMECIEESADIVEKKVVSRSGRQLIWYARR
jgi:ribosomal protein L11 methylase PrmA